MGWMVNSGWSFGQRNFQPGRGRYPFLEGRCPAARFWFGMKSWMFIIILIESLSRRFQLSLLLHEF